MTLSKTPTKTEEQLAAALLERLYAPLVKKLKLTVEQNKGFYQVILENKMKGMVQMADLLRHEDPSLMVKAVAESQKETDARLQALLGAAHFAQYQEYQTNIGDRGLLEQTKDDFAEHPLTEEQQQHLLAAMAAGRKAVGNNAGSNETKFSIADTVEVFNEKLRQQESINQQILEQAASFLSPSQLEILGAIQIRMMSARKEGHAKIRTMFGDLKSNGGIQS
jgi:hypothetical protein